MGMSDGDLTRAEDTTAAVPHPACLSNDSQAQALAVAVTLTETPALFEATEELAVVHSVAVVADDALHTPVAGEKDPLDYALAASTLQAMAALDAAEDTDEERRRSTSAWIGEVVAAANTPNGKEDDISTTTTAAGTSTAAEKEKSASPVKPRSTRRKEPKDDTAATPSATERRKRGRPAASSVEDEATRAFRHAQRAMRREAKNVCLRDLMGRGALELHRSGGAGDGVDGASGSGLLSMLSPSEIGASSGFGLFPAVNGTGADPFSPTSSSVSSSAWSPLAAGDVTSRFLATVKQQRQQTVARVVEREYSRHTGKSTATNTMTTTVTTMSSTKLSLGGGGGASVSFSRSRAMTAAACLPVPDGEDSSQYLRDHSRSFAHLQHSLGHTHEAEEDELQLVIGEEEEKQPTCDATDEGVAGVESSELDVFSPTSASSQGEFSPSLIDTRVPSYLGGALDGGGELQSLTGASGLLGVDPEEEERRVAGALRRKHEMMKLRHRQQRAQQLAARDHGKATTLKGKTAGSMTEGGPSAVPARPRNEEEERGMAALHTALPHHARRHGLAPGGSISDANLSESDISMIRRLNSFDNASSQRVTVFGAQRRGEDSR